MTCTWPGVVRLLRARVAQVWGGVVLTCIAFELAWVTYYDSLGSKTPPGPSAEGFTDLQVLEKTLGTTSDSYTLPFAVGLPILCGFTLAQDPDRIPRRGRLAVVLGIAFVVAHFLIFWQNVRRYAVGYNGPVLFWHDAAWSPPFPSLLLLIAYAFLLVALALWFWGATTTDSSEDEEPEDAAVTALA